ncbi:MAG: hypothetical protein ACTSRP_26370 [Candidatus Helarchaeota archaeon]
MVHGLIIFRFDEKAGMKKLTAYPEDIDIDDKATMQVYTTHAFEGEKGFLTITIGDLNIASYFTGLDSNYYICLLLSIDENPEDYEDVLTDSVRTIMNNLEYRRYIELLPEIFKNIVNYPKMDRDQRLALTYLDPIKKMILDRLIEDGSATKSELLTWLKDRLARENIDIDGILHSMIKMGLVVESTLKEMPSSVVFLVGDIFVTRVPPINIVRKAKLNQFGGNLDNDYLTDVRAFFENYAPTPEDQEIILNILINMDAYKIIKQLRENYMTMDDMALMRQETENLDDALKILWDNRIINVLRNKKGEELYFLRTDIAIKLVFPEYLINLILESYNDGTKADPILIEHLNILRDTYNLSYR